MRLFLQRRLTRKRAVLSGEARGRWKRERSCLSSTEQVLGATAQVLLETCPQTRIPRGAATFGEHRKEGAAHRAARMGSRGPREAP